MYIDGKLYKELTPSEVAPSNQVLDVCRGYEGEMQHSARDKENLAVGFKLDLPALEPSLHEVSLQVKHGVIYFIVWRIVCKL